MSLPPELAGAAARPVELTVAGLLELFGERNRDPEIVGRIEGLLAEAGLACVPTLIHGHLDSPVTVQGSGGTATAEAPRADEEETVVPESLRVGDLPSARLPEGGLVSLSPGDDLPRARMVMLDNQFSQLPVMSGPYMLKGVVSWQSIAMAHAIGKCETLADVTATAPEVSVKAELLATIPQINEQGFVFVRDSDHRISGLVTSADLSLEFGRLTGPFLMLGEIERRLRRGVDLMCPTAEELQEATGIKGVQSAGNLTLGKIVQIFSKPDRWERLNWGLPQQDFVNRLDNVRKIRNHVAHFRPNPITEEQREEVKRFAGLVKTLLP